MNQGEFRRKLAAQREQFRARLAERAAAVAAAAKAFPGRIGVVLSGGGARGAYEAGVLLAFQDAQLATHILAATSVGSINAASYAANSSTLVGNAEPLIESWNDVTAATVGIDWSRYVFMLAGLVAATAGTFNVIQAWFLNRGIFLHSHHPMITWLAMAAAGASLLMLYDQLPYVIYVITNYLRGGRWKPDRGKALRSLGANLLVWGFVYLVLNYTHLHTGHGVILEAEISTKLLMLLLVALVATWWFVVRERLSVLSHRFLRLPLRTGLFPNYERTKFLRGQIPVEGLRASPIRVIMTATDLRAGAARYFTNGSVAELRRDPQVNQTFVRYEVEQATDLLQAVIASSAFTIAYEAVPMQDRLFTDGGVVTNQPIRPAVRMGADILFLIMVEPMDASSASEVRTFLDVGLRAVEILVTKNLKADLKLLDRVNRMCEVYAATQKLKPEQVQVEIGEQSFKFVKAFTVCPGSPLRLGSLDFGGEATHEGILQGYLDGASAAMEFDQYVATLPRSEARTTVKLVPSEAARTTPS
jgi:predicted acylesterase/phospholipase RssA